MKKLLFLLICTIAGMTAQARKVTEQEALQKAQQFFNKTINSQTSKRSAPLQAAKLTLASNRVTSGSGHFETVTNYPDPIVTRIAMGTPVPTIIPSAKIVKKTESCKFSFFFLLVSKFIHIFAHE